MLELRVKAGRRVVPIFDLPAALGRVAAYREVGDTIDGLIAFMDDLDGDPDLEETGEREGAGQFAYNAPLAYSDFDDPEPTTDGLSGDPVDAEDTHDREGDTSDDEPDDDAQGDVSWIEWQTRGSHKVDRFGGERLARGRHRSILDEDVEDDDADTGVEDHPEGFDPEEDRCPAGDDAVIAGPVQERGYWLTGHRSFYPAGHDIGDADDAERSGAHGQSWGNP